jgi:hypothetical protein
MPDPDPSDDEKEAEKDAEKDAEPKDTDPTGKPSLKNGLELTPARGAVRLTGVRHG